MKEYMVLIMADEIQSANGTVPFEPDDQYRVAALDCDE
jgi:hypothetical protein